MLSTAAMVRLRTVYENLMIDWRSPMKKLRKRGLRILTEASGAIRRQRTRFASVWTQLRAALTMLKTESMQECAVAIETAKGNLRQAWE